MTTSTRGDELSLIDTNVVVYALDSESEFHRAAKALLERSASPEAQLCIAPQTLAEFYAILTNPRRVRRPKPSHEVVALIEALLDRPGLSLLPTPSDVVDRWLRLLRRFPVTGNDIFDLQLAATMLGNGVRRIHTFNTADFKPLPEIEVIQPLAVNGEPS